MSPHKDGSTRTWSLIVATEQDKSREGNEFGVTRAMPMPNVNMAV